MFLISEVHPFDDGNGRIGRVMMNAEFVAASEHRILIPQVYRNNYLMALRALTSNARADALIATLAFAQRYTAAIDFSSLERAQAMLDDTNAFRDPTEADATGVRLTLPEPPAIGRRWQIAAGPREYTGTPGGVDIDIGWAWDIERDGQRRTVRVEVAGGRLTAQDLSREARDTITTKGESAIRPLLLHAEPAARVLVTSDGLFTQPPEA
jgi:hypothetical protein